MVWPEIKSVLDENKRELKLSGTEIKERIVNEGLDPTLLTLESLNLLTINDVNLEAIPDDISNLSNLQTLMVYGNQLQSIPQSIGSFTKLKFLDLSGNALVSLPDTIGQLINLTTINVSGNKLTAFPTLEKLTKLTMVNLSGNELTQFPNIFSCVNIAELKLETNNITAIPYRIDKLINLKDFTIASNKVTTFPKSLANLKLKSLNLKGNPVADKRLLKLINQCTPRQVLDYVKTNGENATDADDTDSTPRRRSGRKNSKKSETLEEPQFKMNVKRHTDDTIKVIYEDSVRDIRQYILGCIVENVDLADAKFREFLQLQTKLHETVCCKREKSTIATHDLNKFPSTPENMFYLRYTTKNPDHLKIHPLGRKKVVTASKLYAELKAEAEASRKQTKRNTYSGIHKYLKLLDTQKEFACMEDATGNVISLPPLTNGELTKISPESTHIFIEITSHSSMNDCVMTMEALLKGMLIGGFGTSTNEESETIKHSLDIRQVKFTDVEGNLRRVYPGRGDLVLDESELILVERE